MLKILVKLYVSIVNIYIIYKFSPKSINSTNALKTCLFGAVEAERPNKIKDPHKYTYTGYGSGFGHTSVFTHPEGNLTRNVAIFGADA